MSRKIIRQENDPILRQVALPIDNDMKMRRMIENRLLQTLSKVTKSAGLAAPQIGVGKRVIAIKDVEEYIIMYNPQILWSSAIRINSNEQCLSFSERYILKRPVCLIYEFEDINGEKQKKFCFYKKARVIEHEVDHLDGLCIDRGRKIISHEER